MTVVYETTKVIPLVECHQCRYQWEYHGSRNHSSCPNCRAMVTFYDLRVGALVNRNDKTKSWGSALPRRPTTTDPTEEPRLFTPPSKQRKIL